VQGALFGVRASQQDDVGSTLLQREFAQVAPGIPTHPARTRLLGMRDAAEVSSITASVATIVLLDATFDSIFVVPSHCS
jgi:hypothetical protein